MERRILPVSQIDTWLAFDTSTESGSVCICRDRTVLDPIFFSGRGRHSADLLSKIKEVIDKQGLVIGDIQGILVGAGPGSFTGVRVAAATAKGLCHSLEAPLWAVSSLRAGAASIDVHLDSIHVGSGERTKSRDQVLMGERYSPRCVLFDARENRVYAACYHSKHSGGMETIIAPHSTTIESILLACESATIFMGDGAQRHFDQISAAGFQVVSQTIGMPTAEAICKTVMDSEQKFRVENISVWEPQYLRVSSAERLRRDIGAD